jgi:hypothetical protein
MDTLCLRILDAYVVLEQRYKLMQDVETNWRELMTEVLSYKRLVHSKMERLKKMSKDEIDKDAHIEPIKIFEQSIEGLCHLLEPIHKKGIFQRTYAFVRNFCGSPENERKLKDYATKISRAAALIQQSTSIQLTAQVSGVENKVDLLIANEKELMRKLDAALAGLREEKNPEIFAQTISSLLGRDINDIKDDLRDNQDELKNILGAGFADVDAKLAEIGAKMDMFLHRSDVPTEIEISDPAASDFWSRNFKKATSVHCGLMRQVGLCKDCKSS